MLITAPLPGAAWANPNPNPNPNPNQVLMTAPLPGAAWAVGGISVDDGARELYAIQRADGRICLGGARAIEPGAAVGSSDDATLSEEASYCY